MRSFWARLIGAAALASGPALAADVASVSRIAFGPDGVLFVADWKAAKVHALSLPPASSRNEATFNILDLSSAVEKAVGAPGSSLDDVAARPGTGEVYVAVSTGPERRPDILVATPDGTVRRLDMKGMASTEAAIEKPPEGQLAFWNRVPERSFTVTAMRWRDGELYLAGLSNQDFASTLRRIRYPFASRNAVTSVEMFHTSHGQVETRAPIRAMTFANLAGKPHLVAAYLCTPLVTVPLDDLKDGAHVRGKTIAELGYGNTPGDLVSYSVNDKGKVSDYVLLTNINRGGETIPLASIEAANAKPSMAQPVPWGEITGVETVSAPLANVFRIDNYNDQFFVALRRDLSNGRAQLVTVGKQFKLRLTDFVSEYDFPSYKYPAGMQADYLKPVQEQMMRQEGFADIVRK